MEPKESLIIESLKETLDCGIPAFIESNIVNIRCRGESMFCEPCNDQINIVLGNKTETTNNFKAHILGDHHKQNVPEKCNVKNISELCARVRPKKYFPQIIYVNQWFLKNEGKYFCKLCNESIISVSSYCNLTDIERTFHKHLLSNIHVDKVKVFYDMCREVKVKLEQIYGIVHPVILDNIEFITKSNSNYCCDLCKITFNVDSTNVDLTIEQFKIHLQSSAHTKEAEQAKAFKKIPKLRDIFPTLLPNYIIRNIEYLNYDWLRSFYFCSLCNEYIPIVVPKCFITPHYETKQKLKYHFSSQKHIESFFSKRDLKSDVYRRLHQLFETYPICVKKCVQSLGVEAGDFYCHSCKCKIKNENDYKYTKKNILSHFAPGYRNLSIVNSAHGDCLEQKSEMSSYFKEYLEGLFGSIPELIQENITYLQMCCGNRNIRCIICEAKLPFYGNPDTVRTNVEQHLKGKPHANKINDIKNRQRILKSTLLKQFTPDCYDYNWADKLTNSVPRFIMNNHKCISYVDTSEVLEYDYMLTYGYDDSSSDDENSDWSKNLSEECERKRVSGNNYVCNVCSHYPGSPKVILAGRSIFIYTDDDLTRNRLIEYNFRTHLLSEEHQLNMKKYAFETSTTQQKMDSLFGTMPTYVYNNIEHMSLNTYFNAIYCTLCKKIMPQINRLSIEEHIMGTISKRSPSNHQEREKCIEESHNRAMELLDMTFWKIPEIVVKNVDFLEISGSNLFCMLCQETLYIDEYDLEQTEYDLCHHMKSRKHMVSLNELNIEEFI